MDTDDGYPKATLNGEWIRDETRIEDLLSTGHAKALTIAGCASNQGRYLGEVDLMNPLSDPEEVMIERIRSRTGIDFGKSEGGLTHMLSDLESIEPRLRAVAHVEVRTDRPPSEVPALVETS